jgi:hypothetical protein
MARHRSPNYPVVNLMSALEYLDRLHAYAKGRHPVPVADAIKEAWGMKLGSAYGLQVVAAVKAFGLIEDKGSKASRQIQVSELGSKIRGGHTDRERLLKQAALLPPLHRELWDKFAKDTGLPPQATLRQYLVFDREGHRFNEATVAGFIEEFEQTVSFAKLTTGDIITEKNGDSDDPEDEDVETLIDPSLKDKEPKPKLPQPAAGLKDFPLYTASQKGALYVPARMTKAEFALVKKQLESYLLVIEATSVDGEPSEN